MKLSDKPMQNADTAARRIDDAFFVMHPHTSELHNFNELGSRIWELLDGNRSVVDIAAAVCAEYGVDPQQAEADVVAFLDELVEKDLISVSA